MIGTEPTVTRTTHIQRSGGDAVGAWWEAFLMWSFIVRVSVFSSPQSYYLYFAGKRGILEDYGINIKRKASILQVGDCSRAIYSLLWRTPCSRLDYKLLKLRRESCWRRKYQICINSNIRAQWGSSLCDARLPTFVSFNFQLLPNH